MFRFSWIIRSINFCQERIDRSPQIVFTFSKSQILESFVINGKPSRNEIAAMMRSPISVTVILGILAND